MLPTCTYYEKMKLQDFITGSMVITSYLPMSPPLWPSFDQMIGFSVSHWFYHINNFRLSGMTIISACIMELRDSPEKKKHRSPIFNFFPPLKTKWRLNLYSLIILHIHASLFTVNGDSCHGHKLDLQNVSTPRQCANFMLKGLVIDFFFSPH